MSIEKGLYNLEISGAIRDFGELTKKTCQSFDEVRSGWQDLRQREYYKKYVDRLKDEMLAMKSDLEMMGTKLSNLQGTLNNLNR